MEGGWDLFAFFNLIGREFGGDPGSVADADCVCAFQRDKAEVHRVVFEGEW